MLGLQNSDQFFTRKCGGCWSEKINNLTSADMVVEREREKETILPVEAGILGKWKRDNFNSASLEAGGAEKRPFYQCDLGDWGSGKETILPVLAGRLGEWKRDNSNSASLEVGGAKKLQFFQAILEVGGAERREF
jgi:hypothetical protein